MDAVYLAADGAPLEGAVIGFPYQLEQRRQRRAVRQGQAKGLLAAASGLPLEPRVAPTLVLKYNIRTRSLLIFAQYSVEAQHAAPAPVRHSLCPKTTLYSAGVNKRTPGAIEDVLAIEDDVVPFDQADHKRGGTGGETGDL